MELEIIRSYLDEQITRFKSRILKENGPLEHLEHEVKMEGCAHPELVDGLMILNALNEESVTLTERVILTDPEGFNAISQRRMELLQHLATHRVDSIRDLAQDLNRDYKNVYDDVKALEKFELIDLERSGKNLRPVSQTERISIRFS